MREPAREGGREGGKEERRQGGTESEGGERVRERERDLEQVLELCSIRAGKYAASLGCAAGKLGYSWRRARLTCFKACHTLV